MVEHKKFRTITIYKNYFQDFFDKQNKKVKANLKQIENTNGLYEIRVQLGSDIFRIFCFFDHEKLVVLANGFQKKTQKTPKNEIELAEKLKKQYFNGKE